VFHAVRRRLGFALLPALLLAGGCSMHGPTSTFEELGDDANTKGFGSLYPPDNREPGEFTFGVGDEVLVDVSNAPEFKGPYVIRPDGKIFVHILGDIDAAGLTASQIRQKFENKLSVFLRPGFSVSVGEGQIVSRSYYVFAHNPSVGGLLGRKVPHTGDLTVFEVWVNMGAPSTLLDDEHHIKVITPDPRNPIVRVVNVKEMAVTGRTGANVQVKPNDIVYVPTTFWGRLNELAQGVSLPFTGLLRISNTIVSADRAVRVISGDDVGGAYGYYGP